MSMRYWRTGGQAYAHSLDVVAVRVDDLLI